MKTSRRHTALLLSPVLAGLLAVSACAREAPATDPPVALSAADLAEDARKGALETARLSAADRSEDVRKLRLAEDLTGKGG